VPATIEREILFAKDFYCLSFGNKKFCAASSLFQKLIMTSLNKKISPVILIHDVNLRLIKI
jgi:hypothetical protein